MNLILKRHPAWLEGLHAPNVNGNLLLLGGDGEQVAVPVPLLLAVSPVVRSLLADHLPPAYSPCCLSLSATTVDVLQVFGEIIATGGAVGAHEDKIEEVRQVFKMLGVEARIVSCHLESIQVGQVLDTDCDIKQECFEEENSCRLEAIAKTEQKEDNGVGEDGDDSNELSPPKKCKLFSKKSSITSAQGKMIVPCNICQKLLQKKALSRHVKAVHDKIAFLCDFCQQTFSQKDNLLRHIKAVHDKIAFLCDICQQTFSQKDNLLRHVKAVHDKIAFQCDLCQQTFSYKETLLRHVKSVHEKIKIPCNLCPKTFTNKRGLSKHVKSVHLKKQVSFDEDKSVEVI